MLLVGAGLFLRTLRNLVYVDLGFNQENLLLFTLNPEESVTRTNLYSSTSSCLPAILCQARIRQASPAFVDRSLRE